MELYPAYYSYRSFQSRQLQTILSHQFSQFISNQCKPCDVITQRRYHLSAVRSSVSKWRFQVNMASGGWRRPTSTETMGEPTKLPPTYFVICFHEKCSQEAVDFISDRLVAPAADGGAGLLVQQEGMPAGGGGLILHVSAAEGRVLQGWVFRLFHTTFQPK